MLTDPQYAILEQAAQRGGCSVFGRQMGTVDQLQSAGLVSVQWWIEGRRSGGGGRWRGRARATPEGKKLVKRPRPPIPLSVQVAVAERQLRELGSAQAVRDERKIQDYLARLLGWLALHMDCTVQDLRLDHDPALVLRAYDHKVKHPAARYTPNANDPLALRWRPQGRQFDGSHDVKTNVRGDHGQLSDTALRMKNRRIEKKREKKQRRMFGAKPKRPVAAQKIRSANRWPPKGSRKINGRSPS